jgi:hypothetical protein
MIQDIGNLDQIFSLTRNWVDHTSYKRFGVVLCAGVLGKPGVIINGELSDRLQTYKIDVLGNLAIF